MAGRGSDRLILLLSATGGHQARALIRKIVSNPDSWSAWDEGRLTRPKYLQVTGMYEIIGNWDLAVFIRTGTGAPQILIRQLRREILKAAYSRNFPPIHESGGKFGRFHGIVPNSEMLSLDPHGSTEFPRTTPKSPVDHEKKGGTKAFIVIDLPKEEEAGPSVDDLIEWMHDAVSKDPEAAAIERVYTNSRQVVLELLSVRPGATDVTGFNRLIERRLSEVVVLKYTLLCYEYDEEPCGWGTPPDPRPGPTGRTP